MSPPLPPTPSPSLIQSAINRRSRSLSRSHSGSRSASPQPSINEAVEITLQKKRAYYEDEFQSPAKQKKIRVRASGEYKAQSKAPNAKSSLLSILEKVEEEEKGNFPKRAERRYVEAILENLRSSSSSPTPSNPTTVLGKRRRSRSRSISPQPADDVLVKTTLENKIAFYTRKLKGPRLQKKLRIRAAKKYIAQDKDPNAKPSLLSLLKEVEEEEKSKFAERAERRYAEAMLENTFTDSDSETHRSKRKAVTKSPNPFAIEGSSNSADKAIPSIETPREQSAFRLSDELNPKEKRRLSVPVNFVFSGFSKKGVDPTISRPSPFSRQASQTIARETPLESYFTPADRPSPFRRNPSNSKEKQPSSVQILAVQNASENGHSDPNQHSSNRPNSQGPPSPPSRETPSARPDSAQSNRRYRPAMAMEDLTRSKALHGYLKDLENSSKSDCKGKEYPPDGQDYCDGGGALYYLKQRFNTEEIQNLVKQYPKADILGTAKKKRSKKAPPEPTPRIQRVSPPPTASETIEVPRLSIPTSPSNPEMSIRMPTSNTSPFLSIPVTAEGARSSVLHSPKASTPRKSITPVGSSGRSRKRLNFLNRKEMKQVFFEYKTDIKRNKLSVGERKAKEYPADTDKYHWFTTGGSLYDYTKNTTGEAYFDKIIQEVDALVATSSVNSYLG